MSQIYVCNVGSGSDEGPLLMPVMDFGVMPAPVYLGGHPDALTADNAVDAATDDDTVAQAASANPSTNLIGKLENMAGIYEDQGLDSDAGELRTLAARLKVEAAQPEVTETPLLMPRMTFGK
jgi:hypothetical protein